MKDYANIRLPLELVEELKLWRRAYSVCYPTKVTTYEDIIRALIEFLYLTEPDVCDTFKKLKLQVDSEQLKEQVES